MTNALEAVTLFIHWCFLDYGFRPREQDIKDSSPTVTLLHRKADSILIRRGKVEVSEGGIDGSPQAKLQYALPVYLQALCTPAAGPSQADVPVLVTVTAGQEKIIDVTVDSVGKYGASSPGQPPFRLSISPEDLDTIKLLDDQLTVTVQSRERLAQAVHRKLCEPYIRSHCTSLKCTGQTALDVGPPVNQEANERGQLREPTRDHYSHPLFEFDDSQSRRVQAERPRLDEPRDDLNPFAGRGVGPLRDPLMEGGGFGRFRPDGNLIGPNHPGFGPTSPFGNIPGQPAGGYGRGVRFDPYNPINGRGIPDPDHEPIPGTFPQNFGGMGFPNNMFR